MEDELNNNLTGRDWCVKIHPDSGQASAFACVKFADCFCVGKVERE